MLARLGYSIRVIFSRTKRPGLIRYGLLVLGPLALALVGAYYYAIGGRYITSENAYVKADKIAISTDVPGRIEAVHVYENQIVEQGTVLFELDREPLELAVRRAEAQLLTVRAEIDGLRALYLDKKKELTEAQEAVAFYREQFEQRRDLMKRGMVSQDRFDSVARNLEAARSRHDSLRQEVGRIRARLGGSPDTPTDDIPEVRVAEARLAEAKFELSRSVVRAPATGIVAKNSLQPGEYVAAGRPVFSIVTVPNVWIEANLKETELTHVRAGQSATITVDTYPGRTWRAQVASIAPATGAEFSILPPQNATGNWVKVVQRIPVRLELLENPDGPPLRAGMSVIVRIDTEHQRELPPIVASAVALIKGEDWNETR